MVFWTGSEFIFCNVNVLETNKLDVFYTKVEMLLGIGRVRYMYVVRRTKDAQSEIYVFGSVLFALAPLTIY